MYADENGYRKAGFSANSDLGADWSENKENTKASAASHSDKTSMGRNQNDSTTRTPGQQSAERGVADTLGLDEIISAGNSKVNTVLSKLTEISKKSNRGAA